MEKPELEFIIEDKEQYNHFKARINNKIKKKFNFFKSNLQERMNIRINHFVQKRNEKTELFENWKGFFKINQIENNNDYRDILFQANENIHRINEQKITFADKMKILIGVGINMSRFHHHEIYGINLLKDNIFINENNEPYIGIPNIIESIQESNSYLYSYPAEFYDYKEIDEDEEEEFWRKSDIYEYGLLIYEILYEEKPYKNISKE